MVDQMADVARERLAQTSVGAVGKTARELFGKGLDELITRETGRLGEELALNCLCQEGLELVERNYSCPFGEADLVMRDGGTVVLCEVKTRTADPRDRHCEPETAVTPYKKRRYRKIAQYYYSMRPWVEGIRFDVVSVEIVGAQRAVCTHFTSAFWDES